MAMVTIPCPNPDCIDGVIYDRAICPTCGGEGSIKKEERGG